MSRLKRVTLPSGRRMIIPDELLDDAKRVLSGEEYGTHGVDLVGVRLVLDIGACIGAFSVWASERWPGCEVMAYEPGPPAFELLAQNVAGLNVHAHQCAVGAADETRLLHNGRYNVACNSLYVIDESGSPNVGDDGIDVRVVSASSLPAADVCKLDVEGAECEILESLDVSRCRLCVYEWHREKDKARLSGMMLERGFTLWSDIQRVPFLGTQRWVRL